MNKPQRRTRKRRENGATRARKYLTEFSTQIRSDTEDSLCESRVMRLLWAESEIQRLLALETNNAIGDPYASAQTVQRWHAQEKARRAEAATMAVAQ